MDLASKASQISSRAWALLAALGVGGLACADVSETEASELSVATEHEADDEAGSPRKLARLEAIGEYAIGPLEGGAAEIIAFDPSGDRLFVTNPPSHALEVIDLGDPRVPSSSESIDLSAYGGAVTSVDVGAGLVAIAVAAEPAQDPGAVVFLRAADLGYVNHVRVGALPDMLGFSPDGRTLVIACEGEPSDDYVVDPEGSVAVIDVSGDVTALSDGDVRLAGFASFTRETLDAGVRVELGREISQDLEPEFVAISADSTTAWVSLQENDAIAVVDLASATVTNIVGLGLVRHPQLALLDPQLALLDGLDSGATPSSWPVFASHQPDGIARFEVDGHTYLLSANEGDCRHYAGLDEVARVRDLPLDPAAFPDADMLQTDAVLGRLTVSSHSGDLDGDGDYDELHTCGSRSIAIWSTEGALVWTSGALLDRLVGADVASDPAPEGVLVAELWGRAHAFVGLEGSGGIAVFDVHDPRAPTLVLFDEAIGDEGPEGLEFVSAADSPSGEPLLIVANEISGTVRVYRLVAE